MNKGRTVKIISAALSAALIVVIVVYGVFTMKSRLPDKVPDGTVRAVFFDVGEADCYLIHGNGAAILTDAPLGETRGVRGYMDRMGIKRIDYFIVTHYDLDHCGDAAKIIEKYDVRYVLMPEPTESDAEKYGAIASRVPKERRLTARTGQSYEVCGIKIDVLSPNDMGKDSNDMCVACRFSLPGGSLLACSDISGSEEKIILSKYGDRIKSDVLKVAHHGSKYSSSEDFIKAVSPEYAVISCGPNSYGHPDLDVIRTLEAAGAEVAVTQTENVIIFDFFSDSVVRKK